MNSDLFYLDLTREDCCRAYADDEGSNNGFTDKDWAWANACEDARKMTDDQLKIQMDYLFSN